MCAYRLVQLPQLGRRREGLLHHECPQDTEGVWVVHVRQDAGFGTHEGQICEIGVLGHEPLLQRAVQQPVELDLREIPPRVGGNDLLPVSSDLAFPAQWLARPRHSQRNTHPGELEV